MVDLGEGAIIDKEAAWTGWGIRVIEFEDAIGDPGGGFALFTEAGEIS